MSHSRIRGGRRYFEEDYRAIVERDCFLRIFHGRDTCADCSNEVVTSLISGYQPDAGLACNSSPSYYSTARASRGEIVNEWTTKFNARTRTRTALSNKSIRTRAARHFDNWLLLNSYRGSKFDRARSKIHWEINANNVCLYLFFRLLFQYRKMLLPSVVNPDRTHFYARENRQNYIPATGRNKM